MAGIGVRREKAALSSGCKAHPAIRCQVIEAHCRHLGHVQLTAGREAAVPCDHVAIAIDQDRDIEAESFNAVGDLPELLFAVAPRIGRIRIELVDPAIDNA